MSQSFSGAEPKIVKQKSKFKDTTNQYGVIMEDDNGENNLNIMYDKRVFRGNTHNMNLLKSNLTPS